MNAMIDRIYQGTYFKHRVIPSLPCTLNCIYQVLKNYDDQIFNLLD